MPPTLFSICAIWIPASSSLNCTIKVITFISLDDISPPTLPITISNIKAELQELCFMLTYVGPSWLNVGISGCCIQWYPWSSKCFSICTLNIGAHLLDTAAVQRMHFFFNEYKLFFDVTSFASFSLPIENISCPWCIMKDMVSYGWSQCFQNVAWCKLC